MSRVPGSPTAVRGFDAEWSGAETLDRAAGAAVLLGRVAEAGTEVPALLSASPLSVALCLGGAMSGRPLAPLGTRLSIPELAAQLDGLGATVLVTDAPNAQLATGVAEAAGVRLVVVEDLEPSDPAFTPTSEDSVVLVLHTSGTTGRAKTVRVRDRAMFHRSLAYRDGMGLSPDDLYCSTGGFHHTGGVAMMFVALACGAGVVPFPRFSVDAWKATASLRPSCALLVPTMIDLLLDAKALDAVVLRGLHYGTAPIHPDTLEGALDAIPGTEFTQAYGMTEGGPISLLTHDDHLRCSAGDTHLLASVGRPLPGLELRFEDVDPGGVGELVVRAPQIFQPDPDGWLHTGDLGRADEEGYLFLQGRKGDKIIRGGENIFPLEVEQVLELHPQVREAAVVGVESRRWGQTLKAVVVPRDPGHPPAVPALVEHCRERLASFKVPEEWEFLDELPRNPAGKLLRGRLS